MSERGEAALTELDGLLALAGTGRVDRAACRRLAELALVVPGRTRRVVDALGRHRDAAAVEALLLLPRGTPGVVEAVFVALRHGVSRELAQTDVHDSQHCPRMLALEFRSSSSRRFPGLLARAGAAFGGELERIRVAGKLHYRFALFESAEPASLRARASEVELDVERLHHDLSRLRGVRLWLNGWCFDDDSSIAPRSRAALLTAWFAWARAQDQPRSNNAIDST